MKGEKKKRTGNTSEEDSAGTVRGSKKKKQKGASTASGGGSTASSGAKVSSVVDAVLPGLGIAHPSDVLDMPVDPNEPTYCLCHQVSYGEMIGCDNPDVSLRFSNETSQRHIFLQIWSYSPDYIKSETTAHFISKVFFDNSSRPNNILGYCL